ncbi:hypothetical protein F5887DRAFT_1072387 [Amanita rubescens]|nr:hypothetical protein F5887DRAFT_1072387 [Amanita rubescens]
MSANSTLSGAGTHEAPLPKFDDTLGALLVGGLFALSLWGVICSQTYTYFMTQTRDRPAVKLSIAFLWLLDTLDSALDFHILYYYLVTNYLNPLAIGKIIWSLIVHVAVTVFSNFLIRAMFTYRIYHLSKKNIKLTTWLMSISTLDLAIAIFISVIAFQAPNFTALEGSAKYLYLAFATGTLSDLSVSVSLCVLLYRSRTGFRRTDSLVRTLLLYTLNTGTLVAIAATFGTVCYAVRPKNFIFLISYLSQSKLYVSSYLAAMNARAELRDKASDFSIHLSELSNYPYPVSGTTGASGNTEAAKTTREGLHISVQTLIDQKVEGGGNELLPSSTRMGPGRAF